MKNNPGGYIGEAMSNHASKRGRATAAIEIRVHGEPKAQPRARATIRGRHASVYNPSTANGWKNNIAVAALPHLPPEPLSGPLRVDVKFIFSRPKSHYRTGKHAGELKPGMPTLHIAKPDRDNLDKACLDSLTDLGFWRDDTQVCDGRIVKMYGEHPGAVIRIEPIRNGATHE